MGIGTHGSLGTKAPEREGFLTPEREGIDARVLVLFLMSERGGIRGFRSGDRVFGRGNKKRNSICCCCCSKVRHLVSPTLKIGFFATNIFRKFEPEVFLNPLRHVRFNATSKKKRLFFQKYDANFWRKSPFEVFRRGFISYLSQHIFRIAM